jgi:hypothetical protein
MKRVCKLFVHNGVILSEFHVLPLKDNNYKQMKENSCNHKVVKYE